jgi:hypothetical protein
MTDNRRRVAYLIAPPRKPADERCESIRRRLLREFEDAGWGVRNLRHVRLTSSGPADSGRRLAVLEPFDAHEIYTAAHRDIVAVVQIAATRVLKDPRKGATARNTMTLAQFVRYKTYFALASPENQIDGLVDEANSWHATARCHGDDDPRCIPLHVFSPDNDWATLHEDVDDFERMHGRANSRRDYRGRSWPKDGEAHGRDEDVVAGHRLRTGFHWDLQAGSNPSWVTNASEVWSVKPSGHLNVYPDSVVRGTPKSARVYQAERPSPDIESGTQPGTPSRAKSRRKQTRRRR